LANSKLQTRKSKLGLLLGFLFLAGLLFGDVGERKSVVLGGRDNFFVVFLFTHQIGKAQGLRFMLVNLGLVVVFSEHDAGNEGGFCLIESWEQHPQFARNRFFYQHRSLWGIESFCFAGRHDRFDLAGRDFGKGNRKRMIRLDLDKRRRTLSQLFSALSGEVGENEFARKEVVEDVWGWQHNGCAGKPNIVAQNDALLVLLGLYLLTERPAANLSTQPPNLQPAVWKHGE